MGHSYQFIIPFQAFNIWQIICMAGASHSVGRWTSPLRVRSLSLVGNIKKFTAETVQTNEFKWFHSRDSLKRCMNKAPFSCEFCMFTSLSFQRWIQILNGTAMPDQPLCQVRAEDRSPTRVVKDNISGFRISLIDSLPVYASICALDLVFGSAWVQLLNASLEDVGFTYPIIGLFQCYTSWLIKPKGQHIIGLVTANSCMTLVL